MNRPSDGNFFLKAPNKKAPVIPRYSEGSLERALAAEGLEPAVDEDLRLALLVAGDVAPGPSDEARN
jgi:hypothetical protein